MPGDHTLGPCPVGERNPLRGRPATDATPGGLEYHRAEQILADLDRIPPVDVTRRVHRDELETTLLEGVERGWQTGSHDSDSSDVGWNFSKVRAISVLQLFWLGRSMSEQALRDEVQMLREQVARLEAARPTDMEGFRQLNDAIVGNRLGAFVREKAQPKWLTRTIAVVVLTPLVVVALMLIIGMHLDHVI